MATRKRAERLTPKPIAKRKPLTREELAARPPPKKASKLTPKQRAARKRRRVPKDERERLARAREERQKREDAEKKVYMNLQTFHIFGAERFGPGPCWVPRRLALAVLEQDRRAVEAENNLFTEKSNIIIQSGRGSSALALQVANPNFQSLWAGENPPIFDQISGRGMDVGQGSRF